MHLITLANHLALLHSLFEIYRAGSALAAPEINNVVAMSCRMFTFILSLFLSDFLQDLMYFIAHKLIAEQWQYNK